MWRKMQPIVLVLSLAMNAGFATAWIAGVVRRNTAINCRAPEYAEGKIWCPLHRRLGVSEAQWREIEPRMLVFHDSTRAVCRQMQTLRDEVMNLLGADNPERAEIESRQQDIAALQQHMQRLTLRHLLREKENLTPSQWQNLLEMMRGNEGCGGHGPLRAMRGRPGCGDSIFKHSWRKQDR